MSSRRVLPGYLRRNPSLVIGLGIVLALLLVGLLGPLFVDIEMADPMSVPPETPPSREHPLGSDYQGRELLAVLIAGIPLGMKVGLLAGTIGIGIGCVLGFISGYYGGVLDTVIRWTADVLLTVPSLMVLVVIASSLARNISVELMAIIVSVLAWMGPTRAIRAQVLSMRERDFIPMARLSGMGGLEIIFREILPNLLPYLASSLVSSTIWSLLASMGLEALGLGPQTEPTLGMTIYWSIQFAALMRGLWWWWAPPIIVIVLLFIGLYLISSGLDELANPRVRRRV
jgi:peptide/nickel transport system permease protein